MNAPLSVPFKMKQSLKESEQAQEYRSGGQTHLTFANNPNDPGCVTEALISVLLMSA